MLKSENSFHIKVHRINQIRSQYLKQPKLSTEIAACKPSKSQFRLQPLKIFEMPVAPMRLPKVLTSKSVHITPMKFRNERIKLALENDNSERFDYYDFIVLNSKN